jgi:PAS domain S-box-containing protein
MRALKREWEVAMANETDLLELLPVAVYTTDAEGRLTFYNQAAVDFWGCRPEIGTARWCGSWRLYWPDGRPMAHEDCPMAIALRERRPVRGTEAIAERPDGTRVPFVPYPTPLTDASGRLTGAINLLVDVSDRDRNELEAAKLAAIVTSSDDAIISKTIDGRITSWNAAATRLLGYEPSEIIGQPITRIIPLELYDEEKEIIARLKRGERIDHYETVRVAKDGRRIEVSLSVSPLCDKFGKVVGAAKVARDITERKQAETLQRLLLEELNHRVKNTLATIQAIANQSLRHSKSPSDFVSGFSGRVQALARAHDVLTQTKLQGADVMKLVREQVLLGGSNDRRVSCSGPMLLLDAQKAVHLALVLHELATNARKYGALSVAKARLSVKWEVRTNGGRNLVIEWKETGGPPVLAPSRRGFGSTLIERTLKAHGGKVSTRYGSEGLTAHITLPLPDHAREAAVSAEPQGTDARALLQSQASEKCLKGKRIIIIEDDGLELMDLESSLTDAGCEIVSTASTLDEAKILIADADCDAALLDANLAGRSVDMLAAMLTKKNIPFAFVTGYGREALPEAFRDAIVLNKPFSQDDLLYVAELLLGQTPGVVHLRRKPVGPLTV